MSLEPRVSPGSGADRGPLGQRPEESPAAPYLRALRDHWLVALFVVLLTVGASAAWLSVRSATYEADAEILVNPIPEDAASLLNLPLIRDTGDPTRTIQTAAELLDSHDAADRAARELGGDWTRTKVEGATDVQPQGQTNIIEVTARGGTAEEAAALANAFASATVAQRTDVLVPEARRQLERIDQQIAAIRDPTSPRLIDLQRVRADLVTIADGRDPTLEISQRAVAPQSAVGLPSWMILALALLAGGVLAAGTALLIEIVTPDRIAGEDDLLRVFPIPILSRIPRLPRSRHRPQPATMEMDPMLREALRTLQVQLETHGPQKRSVMIASASRGDGKTTVAANLALELAEGGALVIALDADLRKPDLAAALGAGAGVAAATPPAAGGESAPPTGDPLRPVPGQENLWVLDLSDVLGPDVDRPRRRTRGLIAGLLAHVDYVVVDTPPLGEVSDALMLLDEIDDVVMVSRIGNTRRLSAEVARDLLARAGVEPAGFVVIGGRATAGRYPYGAS